MFTHYNKTKEGWNVRIQDVYVAFYVYYLCHIIHMIAKAREKTTGRLFENIFQW